MIKLVENDSQSQLNAFVGRRGHPHPDTIQVAVNSTTQHPIRLALLATYDPPGGRTQNLLIKSQLLYQLS